MLFLFSSQASSVLLYQRSSGVPAISSALIRDFKLFTSTLEHGHGIWCSHSCGLKLFLSSWPFELCFVWPLCVWNLRTLKLKRSLLSLLSRWCWRLLPFGSLMEWEVLRSNPSSHCLHSLCFGSGGTVHLVFAWWCSPAPVHWEKWNWKFIPGIKIMSGFLMYRSSVSNKFLRGRLKN